LMSVNSYTNQPISWLKLTNKIENYRKKWKGTSIPRIDLPNSKVNDMFLLPIESIVHVIFFQILRKPRLS